MLGLVLEGGGQKGAFHAGVIKALYENGYRFDGVTGSSIGAINAFMVAQGDIELCYEVWSQMTPSQLVDVDDSEVEKVYQRKFDKDSILYFLKFFKGIIKNKGLSMEKIRVFVNKYLDEDRIRKSKIDLGFVTIDTSDGFRPVEVFKEEIPYGMLSDYVLASAYYPVFRRDAIEGRTFLDGGIYDNLPINPLIRRGYDEIIAVRTMSSMPHQKVVDETVKVHYIEPSESLGDTIVFTNEAVNRNLKLGYYDGLRFIHGYAGKHFYVINEGDVGFQKFVSSFTSQMYDKVREILSLPSEFTNEEVIKAVINRVNLTFRLSTELTNYERLIIGMEFFAKKYKLEKFKVYSFHDFFEEILRSHRSQGDGKSDIIKLVSKFFDKNLLIIFSLYMDSLPEVENETLEMEKEADTGNGPAK